MQEWKHGTRHGYLRHLYVDGKACAACLAANAKYQRDRRAKVKARRG